MVSSPFSARTTCSWHISKTFSFLGQTLASLTVYYNTSTDDLLRSPLTGQRAKSLASKTYSTVAAQRKRSFSGEDRCRGQQTQAPAQTPKPARWLILCYCFQQDLRHLQRSLHAADLVHLWRRWTRLNRELNLIRGSGQISPERLAIDNALVTLPTRVVGVGHLSHEQCGPHALQAANDASDAVLHPLVPAFPSHQTRWSLEGCAAVRCSRDSARPSSVNSATSRSSR